MIATRNRVGSVAVALLALLLLSYASVRSTVMQGASRDGGMAMACGMPGMSHAIAPHTRQQPADSAKHSAACPYCSVAANPATVGDVTPIRIPTSFIFVAFHPVKSHGPRGPPAFEARARGPPLAFTTA